jgi:hypothetical protein
VKVTLTFQAPLDVRRYVYTEMARLGLSQENMVDAHMAEWNIFETILEFEVPDVPDDAQSTTKIARRRREI